MTPLIGTFSAGTARRFGWLFQLVGGGPGLYSWGYNANGQLGLGDILNRSSPVQIGTLTTWSVIAGGGDNGFAIKTDGTLYAWGVNGSGRLGLGDTTTRSTPVQVGALTTWTLVNPGGGASYAIRT